jgi:CHAT domain-containing protein/tetratricopeptide (TPR) repeat protein
MRVKTAWFVVFIGGLFLVAKWSLAAGPREDRKAEIAELRSQGRYHEATEVARALLQSAQADSSGPSYELRDAERLVAALEQAAALPPPAQQQLAEAERLAATARELYKQGSYRDGVVACRRALVIRRSLLGSENVDLSESLYTLAVLLNELAEFPEAAALLQESLAMRRVLLGSDHPEVASTIGELAGVLRATGQYADAETLFRESLALRRRALGPEHADVARSLNGLANLLRDKGDLSGAESTYREALALRRRLYGRENVDAATSLLNLGSVLRAEGKYTEAETLLREALTIQRKLLGNQHSDVASGLNNLAVLLSVQGNYTEAEPLLREAVAIHRKALGSDNPSVALNLNNLGNLLWTKGDYAEAEKVHREALALRRKALGREHPAVGESLHNLANTLLAEGKYAEADSLLREALAVRRRALGSDHPAVASDLQGIAILLHATGEDEAAEPLCVEALALRGRLRMNQDSDAAAGLHLLAEIRLALGNEASSESLLVEATEVFEAARLRVGSGRNRATFLRKSPYTALAAIRLLRHKYTEAWPALERSRGRVLADLLMATESRHLTPEEAAQEDSLRRALGDRERQLEASRKAVRADSSAGARQRVAEAETRLLEIQARWSAFASDIAAQNVVTEGQSYDLARVQAVLAANEAIVGWLDAAWGEREDLTRRAWGYVIRNTGPVNWVALELADPAGVTAASGGAPRTTAVTTAVPAAAVRVDKLAHLYRDALSASDRSAPSGASHGGSRAEGRARHRDIGRLVYLERIAPLLPYLEGVRSIIVIPSDEMLGIPLEAVPQENGEWLGRRFAMSYAPSATVLTWLRERDRATMASLSSQGTSEATDDSHPFLLLGDPIFNERQIEDGNDEPDAAAGWTLVSIPDSLLVRSAVSGSDEALAQVQRLPATRREVIRIASLDRNATVLLGAEASEQRLVQLDEAGELERFRTIHLATHAWLHPVWPEQSALLLSRTGLPDPLEAAEKGERIFDGLLSVKEILQEWRLNADLVTLSGCETALGQTVAGEGYMGFAHAFLQVGARSVLVSLWRVEDEATAILMERFYQNLYGSGPGEQISRRPVMSKREALRQAQAYLRDYQDNRGGHPYAEPFYWAPFVLVGDPD